MWNVITDNPDTQANFDFAVWLEEIGMWLGADQGQGNGQLMTVLLSSPETFRAVLRKGFEAKLDEPLYCAVCENDLTKDHPE